MAERRRFKRFSKRYTVRFGEKDLTFSGFTVDISSGGLFIVSAQLPPLDTRLLVQVLLDEKRPPVFLVGVVQRHKMVPPELRTLAKNGFGFRVLRPEEQLRPLIPALPQESDALQCLFETVGQFKSIWDTELRHGGVFVRSDRTFTPHQEVKLQMQLAFAQTQLEVPCRVVHIAGAEGGPKGVGVLFSDPAGIRDVLSRFAK